MNSYNANAEESDETRRGGGVRAALITAIATVLVAIIGVIGAFLQAQFGGEDASPVSAPATVTATVTVSPSPQPTLRVDRAISSPEANTAVPLCADVKGSVGSLPKGKALVVAVQEDEDTRIYFEQSIKFPTRGLWSARVSLGDIEHPGDAVNHRFSIYAVTMDETLARYLADTNTVEGDTWWSSTAWPPSADPGEATQVVRSTEVGKC